MHLCVEICILLIGGGPSAAADGICPGLCLATAAAYFVRPTGLDGLLEALAFNKLSRSLTEGDGSRQHHCRRRRASRSGKSAVAWTDNAVSVVLSR